jgi:hypothetical protein
MKRDSLGKIIILLIILGVLCYLYFTDKLNYEYMCMCAELIRELLKHILIEVIEHFRW